MLRDGTCYQSKAPAAADKPHRDTSCYTFMNELALSRRLSGIDCSPDATPLPQAAAYISPDRLAPWDIGDLR